MPVVADMFKEIHSVKGLLVTISKVHEVTEMVGRMRLESAAKALRKAVE